MNLMILCIIQVWEKLQDFKHLKKVKSLDLNSKEKEDIILLSVNINLDAVLQFTNTVTSIYVLLSYL